jgi:hypothetical protein
MTTELDPLRARMSGTIGAQLPGHRQRLHWSSARLAAFQRDRLRALLARAIERSPFHAARLRGIDPARFELADLPRLPVMTKAEMMADFEAAVTDPRLTRDLVEQHLAGSAAEIFPNGKWFPSWATGLPPQALAQTSSCSSRIAPRCANRTPSAAYSSRCQLTVGCTTSRPPLSRSSVARSFARASVCRSGLMIARCEK